jgi:hypothetical protein
LCRSTGVSKKEIGWQFVRPILGIDIGRYLACIYFSSYFYNFSNSCMEFSY